MTECINTTLKIFKWNFSIRWKQCNRVKQRFHSKHSNWIDKDLKFPEKVYLSMKTHSISQNPSTSDFGRPKKIFSESGERTKRKIIKPLIEEHPVDELAFATQFSLRAGKLLVFSSIILHYLQKLQVLMKNLLNVFLQF